MTNLPQGSFANSMVVERRGTKEAEQTKGDMSPIQIVSRHTLSQASRLSTKTN
jgi:hypothetical protein